MAASYFALGSCQLPQGFDPLMSLGSVVFLALTGNIALIQGFFKHKNDPTLDGANTEVEANLIVLSNQDLGESEDVARGIGPDAWSEMRADDTEWMLNFRLRLRYIFCHTMLLGFVWGSADFGSWKNIRTLLRLMPQDPWWQLAARQIFCVQRIRPPPAAANLPEFSLTDMIQCIEASVEHPVTTRVFDVDQFQRRAGRTAADEEDIQFEEIWKGIVDYRAKNSLTSPPELQKQIDSLVRSQRSKKWQIVKRARKIKFEHQFLREMQTFVLYLNGMYLPSIGGEVHLNGASIRSMTWDSMRNIPTGGEIRVRFPSSLMEEAGYQHSLSGLSLEEKEGQREFANASELCASMLETDTKWVQGWRILNMMMPMKGEVWLDDGTGRRKWKDVEVAVRAAELSDLTDNRPWNSISCAMGWKSEDKVTVMGKEYTQHEVAKKAIELAMADEELRESAPTGIWHIWDTVGITIPLHETMTVPEFYDYNPEVDPSQLDKDSKVVPIKNREMTAIECLLQSLKGDMTSNAGWLHLGRYLAENDRLRRGGGESDVVRSVALIAACRFVEGGDAALETVCQEHMRILEGSRNTGKKLPAEILGRLPAPENKKRATELAGQFEVQCPQETKERLASFVSSAAAGSEGECVFGISNISHKDLEESTIVLDAHACFLLSIAVDEEALLSMLQREEEPAAMKELVDSVGRDTFSVHAQRVLEADLGVRFDK